MFQDSTVHEGTVQLSAGQRRTLEHTVQYCTLKAEQTDTQHNRHKHSAGD